MLGRSYTQKGYEAVSDSLGVLDTFLPGAGAADITFRTQVSPDLVVPLLSPSGPPPQQPGLIGRAANWVIGTIVKPEMEVRLPLGYTKIVAPYGRPTQDYTVPLAMFAGIGIISVGASIYYFLRRR